MNSDQKSRLKKALSQFKLKDLHDFAIQEFPETSWNKIQNYFKLNKLPLMQKHVINYLINILEGKKLTNDCIEARISTLSLLGVGFTTRRVWKTFQLIDKTSKIITLDSISKNIKSTFKIRNCNVDFNIVYSSDKLIMSVEKKKVGKRKTTRRPVYFIYVLPFSYFFCSNKSVDKYLMEAIVTGLGYAKYKYCYLDGKEIFSLLALLRKKEGYNVDALYLQEESVKEIIPEKKCSTNELNFIQCDSRKKYADDLYGADHPKLQSLTVSTENYVWQRIDNEKMDGELFNMELCFGSKDVIGLMKDIITNGYMAMPMLGYMENILTQGKNVLKIQPEIE